MAQAGDIAGGWAFLVFVSSLLVPLWVAPWGWRLWRARSPLYGSVYEMVRDCIELRMVLGFGMSSVGVAIFAAVMWLRTVMIEAGAAGSLVFFGDWGGWLLAPSATSVVFGKALVLWDGLARPGACLAMLVATFLLWWAGTLLSDYLILHWPLL